MAATKRARRNEDITTPEVRVISADGEQLGILQLADAIEAASGKGLDLVEVAPNAEPPVCRIMDYGKYLFEQNKKAHSARRKQKQIHVKEVKFRPGTEEGDYQVKLRNLIRFLTNGDKTKVTLRFRGREMAHQNLGRQLLERVRQDLEEYGAVEQRPQLEGRQMVMVIGPKKK
ncbi:MAG: translation initiation factor IF-3 [Chromatiales bacterium]|nr:translation initiation factor IF-3 [Chromatiales bacterium]MDH3931481.1 translation initiation factor IF-3 [Chromatiales bacterium]PLX54781.1 MAG: translation initiation factor IF-3 [Chromatiales bacterium]